MVTKRFLKNVIVAMVSVFMSLVVVQGAQAEQTGLDYQNLHLLPFNGNKQLVLGDFDHLGRATSAHIQLQDKDEPKEKKENHVSAIIRLAGTIIRLLMETKGRRPGCSIEGI